MKKIQHSKILHFSRLRKYFLRKYEKEHFFVSARAGGRPRPCGNPPQPTEERPAVTILFYRFTAHQDLGFTVIHYLYSITV